MEQEGSNDCDENVYKSELSFFSHRENVNLLIGQLCSEKLLTWETAWKEKWEWLIQVISEFQEQNNLLNPYLEEIISPITNKILLIIDTLNLHHTSVGSNQVMT